MNLIVNRSNGIGIMASMICLLHCLAAPVIFMTNLSVGHSCEAMPFWWQWLDYIFLVIAFLAVYQSARTTTKKSIGVGLWVNWGVLFLIVINEHLHLFTLPESTIYFPTLSLIFLHFYNRKFCECRTGKCCIKAVKIHE